MKRYLPLDLLRGLSVFGMVFSAIIPYSMLPAWMYHVQNPPPLHVLDISISGISWVDLVFPVFIFCMGVAIPIAGNKRKGEGTKAFIIEVLERFLMLWLFSYLYVLLNFDQGESIGAQLATIAGFLSLFPLYMVLRKRTKNRITIRFAGIAVITLLIILGHFLYGEKIAVNRSGIIIFLLAFLYLFGALIWYFTRNKVWHRFAIFILVLLFFICTAPFDLQKKLYAIEEIRWFLNLEYFYFLLILLPATYAGDILYGRLSEPDGYEPLKGTKYKLLLIVLLSVLVVWQLTALYNGWLFLNIGLSAILFIFIWYLVKNYQPVYKKFILPAIILLFAGLIALLIEGSITKVPCTVSYCFISTALSICLLIIMDYVSLCMNRPATGMLLRIFAGAGSNPLMSYVAFGNFLMPLFKVTGLIVIYEAAYPPGYPWTGVARAFFAVLLTMSLVAFLSERKIYWRA